MGESDFDYFLFIAADRLNMSVPALEAHPRQGELMRRALTVIRGENIGAQLAREAAEQTARTKI